METLVQNISQILGITIIHSLWQGLLVYLALRLLLAVLPALTPVKKHNLSFTAMGMLAVWFLVTLANEATQINWHTASPAGGMIPYLPKYLNVTEQSYRQYQYALEKYLPYIAVVYMAGLLFNTLKLCFAWRNIVQVKQSLIEASGFDRVVTQLSGTLKLSKKVSVYFSEMVDVPGMIGPLKPIVLLPIGIANNLSTAEVEAILLHELAHIKRNDYLLNMIQQIIGVMLFYNPFAMLINRHINTERENCCDDEVVTITGEPLIYARALLKLEQQKQNTLQLALAATGKKHLLLNRIERIMTTKKLTINVRHTLAALLLFAFSLGSIAWFNPQIKNNTLIVNTDKPEFVQQLLGDTVPAKKRMVKTKKPIATKSKIVHIKGKTVNIEDDPELEKLSAEVSKHGDAISKFYESAEFKRIGEEMEKNGKELDAYYNSPALKALTEKQEKLSLEMEKLSNDPEMDRLNKQMEALGKNMDVYFNSPEFKKVEKKLEVEGQKLEKLKWGTAAFEQQAKQLEKLSKELSAYTNSPKLKQQQEQMQDLSQKLRDHYQGDNYRHIQEAMRSLSDSLRQAYQSKSITLKSDNMRLLSQKMNAYQNNPTLKQHQQELKKATEKLNLYLKSDAYQQKLKKAIEEQTRDSIKASNYIDNTVSPEF
ncbi:M48 family metalloprotease [Mucilaginibacter sp. UR6-1]|uniref:M56 family metallopeptidase n=1 Tax=Mucilaginibacter sp. UR6-1 TaxID=1435643 RepID=UPI001E30E758|nr:M56 family metallopeptidase [Mucilaginibacter sp. UR6-1]MCC8411239.1 M48 family metalloprotease [Mucilaginibacter sp. UR6-1]